MARRVSKKKTPARAPKKPRLRHAPTPIDDELIAKIGAKVAKGVPLRTACDLFCVAESTIYSWMREGQAVATRLATDPDAKKNLTDRDVLVHNLYAVVRYSRAKFKCTLVEKLTDPDNPMWHRDLAILARTDPKSWGQNAGVGDDEDLGSANEQYM